MTMRDEDFEATLTLAEGEDGLWSPSMAASVCEPSDWQSLYEQAEARAEQERARADAVEARAEELVVAERTARSQAGSLKWNLDQSRDKLEAAVEEVKKVCRTAKDALFYHSEVTRLEKLLSEAGVDSRKRSTITSLRVEAVRLRRDLRASEAAKDTAAVRPPKTASTRKPPCCRRDKNGCSPAVPGYGATPASRRSAHGVRAATPPTAPPPHGAACHVCAPRRSP